MAGKAAGYQSRWVRSTPTARETSVVPELFSCADSTSWEIATPDHFREVSLNLESFTACCGARWTGV